MLNADDWKYYHALSDPPSPEKPPQDWGTFLGNTVQNFVPSVARSFVGTMGGVTDRLTGAGDALSSMDAERQQAEDAANPNYPVPPKGFLGATANVLLNKVAPELPMLAATGSAGSAGASILGAGPRLSALAGSMTAGALSGNRESLGEAGVQAGEFGLMDAAGMLVPKGARPLWHAAIQGAAGAGVNMLDQKIRGNDSFSEQGLASTATMAAFPFLMKGRDIFKKGEGAPPTPPVVAPSALSDNGIPSDWKLRSVTETPEGRFAHVYDTPTGEVTMEHEHQLGETTDPSFQTQGQPYGPPPTQRPARKMLPQYSGGQAGDVIEGSFERAPLKQLNAPTNENQGTAILGTPQLRGRDFNAGKRGFTIGEGSEPFTPTPDVVVTPERKLLEAPKLRPLPGGESGAVSHPLLQSLAGGAAGALGGYLIPGTDDQRRNRALMFGAAGLGILGGKKLLRAMRSPEGQKSAENQVKGQGKTLLGATTRFAEKNLHLGRDSSLNYIQSGARGTGTEAKERLQPLLNAATLEGQKMTPSQRASLDVYSGSDRGAGAKALLEAAGIPKAVKDYIYESEKVDDASKEEMIKAEPNPERQKIMRSTMGGQYQRRSYEAFHNPTEWQKHGVEPDLLEKIVSDNETLPDFQGMTRDQIRKDTQDYFGSVATHGHENFGQPGATRMSKNIFTKRKEIRPLVQDALGRINDPIARQAITSATLIEQAVTAKIINDLHRIPDEKERKQLLNEDELAQQYESARTRGDKEHIAYLDSMEQVPDLATLGTMGQGSVPGMKPPGVGNEQYGMTMRKYDAQMAEAKAKGDTAAINRLSTYVPHNAKATMYATRHVMDMMQAGPAHAGVGWVETLLKPLAKIQALSKGSFTLYNIGTHLHNWFQAPIVAIANGVGPVDFVRGKVDPARIEKFKKLGLLDSHHAAQEFTHTMKSSESILTPTLWDKAKDVHEAVKGAYGKSDQLVRMHAANRYLDEGTKHGLKGEALDRYTYEMTNRYTPDYSTVLPAIKVASNIPLINPFIRYTAEIARIVKNVAQDVISDPMQAKYGISKRAQSAKALAIYLGLGAGVTTILNNSNLSEEQKQKWESLLPLMPPYARNRSRVKLGYDTTKDQGTSFNLNPWLPAEDLVQTAKNILAGDWDAVKDTNPLMSVNRSPLLNMTSEIISGKDPVTNAPSQGILSAAQKNFLPSWLPGGYQAKRLAQGFTRNAEGGLGVTDAQGRAETPLSGIGALLGVSVEKYDKRQLLRRQQFDQKEAVQQAQSKLKSILGSNTNDGVKEAARQDFKATMDEIIKTAPVSQP